MSPASKGVILVAAVLIGLFIIGLFVAEIWSLKTNSGPQQRAFLAGSVPNPLPSGFYQGAISVVQGSWVGKGFDATAKMGVNYFAGGTSRDPFKFYVGAAASNKNTQVLKIDYNISSNPFWLRHVLDEVVETSPGQYLGKLNVRFAGRTFALAYFHLTK